MLKFARYNGLDAEEYNNASWSDLTTQLDEGHPVQAMFGGGGNPPDIVSSNDVEYINSTGYGTDPSTGEQYICSPEEDPILAEHKPESSCYTARRH